ncbi:Hypothetical predicted protein [Olea europaea subsp. europaea]|uniref:Uncharacterized protein n=1 Tax=Olea europaea subsp. europaea TaxID=158383 RepID=A0A8S0U7M2_OLEEU|nr:Hypothetical predicted protein [Olea europaea subsp. europaea]
MEETRPTMLFVGRKKSGQQLRNKGSIWWNNINRWQRFERCLPIWDSIPIEIRTPLGLELEVLPEATMVTGRRGAMNAVIVVSR